MNEFQRPSYSMFPPAVKNLLIANVVLFFATFVVQHTYNYDLSGPLGLRYIGSSNFRIYQVITYMFMHGNLSHIGFNMFALWMFGFSLENLWGAKKFLIFYFICGIGAAITQEITQYFYFEHLKGVIDAYQNTPDAGTLQMMYKKYFYMFNETPMAAVNADPNILWQYFDALKNEFNTLGASGAIFGILLAYAMYFPNNELYYIFLPIPIKAKYFVLFYGLLELFFAVSNKPGDNVAHFAHLGGMVFGFFVLLYWRRKRI